MADVTYRYGGQFPVGVVKPLKCPRPPLTGADMAKAAESVLTKPAALPCPKCGGTMEGPTYCEAMNGQPEHLWCKCSTCGYITRGPCLDAKPTPRKDPT
jgi:hypothetical protein